MGLRGVGRVRGPCSVVKGGTCQAGREKKIDQLAGKPFPFSSFPHLLGVGF